MLPTPQGTRSEELMRRAAQAAINRRGKRVPLTMRGSDDVRAGRVITKRGVEILPAIEEEDEPVEEGDDAAGEEVGESHVDDDDDVTPIEEEAQVEGEEEEGGLQ